MSDPKKSNTFDDDAVEEPSQPAEHALEPCSNEGVDFDNKGQGL